jgi:bifunctional non-homologous end joining protein LigD
MQARDSMVAGIPISNSDRVLIAKPKLTKLDLAQYYADIADWILPYIAGRPLTLVRCPIGLNEKCFYQKHWTGSLPDAIRSVKIQEKQSSREYVVIEDVAGLVTLIQYGVFEIHPWPAPARAVEQPNCLVFDLDPGEQVTWSSVITAARNVRLTIEKFGLASFVRTSGGKGLHVVAPLTGKTTWDELKLFAKHIAKELISAAPDRYTYSPLKAKRHNKVFVDYLRNQRGATSVASYSTRARPGAPVATPLAWDELTARIRANSFRVGNVRKRLDGLKQDPWADFFAIRQTLKSALKQIPTS